MTVKAPSALSTLSAHVLRAHCWEAGAHVLVGCSGGPDSLGLLLALDELRRAGHLALTVGHVHHGLREDDADDDAAHVATVADRLGVPRAYRRADVLAALGVRRRGLEDAARAVRHVALEEMRREAGADVIALAHTADDQAETLLLRLMRGAGPEGLGAMSSRSDRLARPLLGVRRRDVRAVLSSAGVAWRSDHTNWGVVSARSMLRPLLARLEEVLDERVVERLCTTAALLREENAWMETLVDEAYAQVATPAAPDVSELETFPRLRGGPAGIGALPPVLARRVMRRYLRLARKDAPPPSADAVDRALRVAAGGPGPSPREAHVAGLAIHRDGDVVRIGLPRSRLGGGSLLPLPVPGMAPWSGLGEVVARWPREGEDLAEGMPRRRALVDPATIPKILALRAPQPGDRFRAAGARRSLRLSRYLAGNRPQAGGRDAAAVVCAADRPDTIVWVVGHAVGHGFAAPHAAAALILEWLPRSPAAPSGEVS